MAVFPEDAVLVHDEMLDLTTAIHKILPLQRSPKWSEPSDVVVHPAQALFSAWRSPNQSIQQNGDQHWSLPH